MASTFSNLKIQLMATGENSGTWGNTTNVNLGTAIEQALVETATVTFASANVTLTLTDSNSAQNARALRLNLAGTTGGARDLIVPAIQKPYIVNNGTADIITVKVAGQTGIAVPASTSMLLYNNGTDVGLAFNRVVANVVGNVTGNVTGTASNATVLQTARTIAISGNVTGTATSFNGSGDISIPVTAINVDAANAGTLAVGRGGTGQTSYTNGQLLIGNTTGNTLTKATLTQGTGITITNGPGSITIAASGAGGFSGSQGFNSPGTFTAPPTTNQVYVVLQAGGGGGGGRGVSPNDENVPGRSGGGGGAAFGVVPVTGGSPFAVTVGAAGSAGNSSNNPASGGNSGNAGGASSFSNLISANGGGAGNRGLGAPTPTPGNPGAGGNGVAPTGVGIAGQGAPNVAGLVGGGSAFGHGGGSPDSAALPVSSGGGGSGSNSPVNATVGGAGFVFVAF